MTHQYTGSPLSKKKECDGWLLHFRSLLKKYIDDELVSQTLNLKPEKRENYCENRRT